MPLTGIQFFLFLLSSLLEEDGDENPDGVDDDGEDVPPTVSLNDLRPLAMISDGKRITFDWDFKNRVLVTMSDEKDCT